MKKTSWKGNYRVFLVEDEPSFPRFNISKKKIGGEGPKPTPGRLAAIYHRTVL